MRKLLYIVHSLNVGGTEILVANLAKHFCKHYQVAILALDSLGSISNELHNYPIQVYTINREAGWKYQNFKNFFKIVEEFRPDLIHAHQYTPFFFSAIAKIFLRTNARLIFTEHGRHYPDLVSKKRQFINRFLWEKVDAVTTVCEFTARALRDKEKCHVPIKVIYNGIDPVCSLETIDLRKTLGLESETVLVLYLGTFRAVKNPKLLIQAMPEIVQSSSNIYLIMIGDGEQKAMLVDQVKESAWAQRVVFLGEIRNLDRYWLNFNIFVQPSLSEAHSLALIEAMSHGLPAIVTQVGGASEVILPGVNGYLVEREDYHELAQKILFLANNLELQKKLGENAKKDYQEKFRSDIMVHNYQNLYTQILND